MQRKAFKRGKMFTEDNHQLACCFLLASGKLWVHWVLTWGNPTEPAAGDQVLFNYVRRFYDSECASQSVMSNINLLYSGFFDIFSLWSCKPKLFYNTSMYHV